MIIDDTQGFDDEPRVYNNISPCLRSERSGLKTTVHETRCLNSKGGIYKIESMYRIRKLTPLECWRLMGFWDGDFRKAEEVNSNSQLYKQAGNSIVKDVLMGIFGEMLQNGHRQKGD